MPHASDPEFLMNILPDCMLSWAEKASNIVLTIEIHLFAERQLNELWRWRGISLVDCPCGDDIFSCRTSQNKEKCKSSSVLLNHLPLLRCWWPSGGKGDRGYYKSLGFCCCCFLWVFFRVYAKLRAFYKCKLLLLLLSLKSCHMFMHNKVRTPHLKRPDMWWGAVILWLEGR